MSENEIPFSAGKPPVEGITRSSDSRKLEIHLAYPIDSAQLINLWLLLKGVMLSTVRPEGWEAIEDKDDPAKWEPREEGARTEDLVPDSAAARAAKVRDDVLALAEKNKAGFSATAPDTAALPEDIEDLLVKDGVMEEQIGFCDEAAMQAINSRIREAHSRNTKWVSVMERLPENAKDSVDAQEYLVFPRDHGPTAFYGTRTSGKPEFYKYGAVIHGVTHYAALPAPPKQFRGAESRPIGLEDRNG